MSDLDPNCERWAEIQDKRLVDDPITDDEAKFAEDHAAECPFCGAESRIYDGMDEDDLSPASADSIVEEVLAKKLPLKSVPKHDKHDNASYLAGAVGAALALAAGVALVLGGIGTRAPVPRVGFIEAASGDVHVNGAPAQAGTEVTLGARIDVTQGRACLAFDSDRARSCLDADTTLVVEKVDPKLRVLNLAKGTVVTALDRVSKGHQFVVSSHGAKATVTGTVFSVTAPTKTHAVLVRVHEGSVKAEAPAVSRPVTRFHELDLGTDHLTQVDLGVRDHELELVGMRVARAQPMAPRPPVLRLQPPAPVAPSASTSEPGAPVPIASAAEMLANARKLRASGNSAGAADAYRKLMGAHPKSAEANAALLSLAELQLGPLGDPAGALRSYDGYLRSGGGLSQEARYGRIMALRRLGRAGEERAAIEQFVQAYPNSVQARALKQKLEGAPKP
jgi:hypothetical protein